MYISRFVIGRLIPAMSSIDRSASKSTVAVELTVQYCARLIICNLSSTMMHWFAIWIHTLALDSADTMSWFSNISGNISRDLLSFQKEKVTCTRVRS